jgi:uncharacterized membrane protein
MRSHKTITSKAVVLAGIFFLCLFAIPDAFAYDYQVTEIQPPAGYTASRAMGINNQGEVVGRFYNIDPATGEAVNRKAFVWDPTNGAYLLPTLAGESSAWAINDNGFVAGYSYNASGKQRAALWDLEALSIDDIGALRNPDSGAYGESSTAYGINNLDQVVGSADIPNNANTFTPYHAFLDDTSGTRDLGTLNTTMPEWQYGYSIAYEVNNKGQVVGIAQDSPWAAFVYDDTNGMRMLPKDPAYADKEWYAVVINDSCLIGGHVIAAENQSLPFYWPNESTLPVRITMPADFPYGEIYGINASGQMVGIMWSSDQAGATEHAFIFDIGNGVRDLNNLIDPASGWVLHFARDINDKGEIVGYGESNGQKRGMLLSMAAPPAPVLVSPENGTNQVGTSVTFSWSAALGAENYQLYVKDASGKVLFNKLVGNVTKYTFAGLPADARLLYWAVYARNAAGTSPRSEQWTLNGEAEDKPPAPVLVSPQNGTSQAGTTVTFSWSASPGAYGYRLYVKDASGEVLFSKLVGNATSYTVTGLPGDGRLLYWAVYAVNTAGTSPWSVQWTLNGEAEDKPPAPVLVSPGNKSNQAGTEVTFSWGAAAGAYDYRLYVKDASGEVLFSKWLGDVTSYTVTSLPGDRRLLYWAVYARNAAGTSLRSKQWVFTNGGAL